MDIALFVGFASAGPLHTPVPLEAMARFEDVFGPDPALARDPTTGLVRHAYLGASVRAFFANGGRRCWVVRVADEAKAERARIALPGVLRVAGKATLSPAFGLTRSAGSFFDGMALRTSLATRSVTLAPDRPVGANSSLTLTGVTPRDVGPGDLLCVRAANATEGWIGYFPLRERLDPGGPGLTFRSGEPAWFRRASEPTPSASAEVTAVRYDATAFDAEQGVTPSRVDSSGTIESWPIIDPAAREPHLVVLLATHTDGAALIGQWLKLEHADGTLWLMVRAAESCGGDTPQMRVVGDAWWEGPAPHAALLASGGEWQAEVVSLDVQVQHEGRHGAFARDPQSFAGLGLTPLHPRAWSSLPDDATHFADRRTPLSEDVRAFREEVDSPRCALAGPPGDETAWFLPLGCDALGSTARASHSSREPLVRDGLDTYSAALFLDEELAATSSDALAAEADFLRFGLGGGAPARTLRGLHAGWALDEVSLVAVPDALHATWTPSRRALLQAANSSEPVRRLETQFSDCRRRVPRTPVLVSPVLDARGSVHLRWTHGEEPGVAFVLQEGRRRDWQDARTIWTGLAPRGSMEVEHVVRDRTPGTYYYRVLAIAPLEISFATCERASLEKAVAFFELYGSADPKQRALAGFCARDEFEFSDWSNGEGVLLDAPPDWEEAPPRDYDPSTWLAVSRSIVRFCGARGDAIALLGLPGHARGDEALARRNDLLAPDGPALPIGERGSSLALGAREAAAWSYAALYHPWIATSAGADAPFTVPPLGAIAGALAARALEQGAWVAPANQPLIGALGLSPSIPSERHQEFLERQLNLLRQEPAGFLVLSQDTLAHDPDAADAPLRPLNVRRLMILLRRLVLRVGEPYVFEPNGENLRARVRHTFESVFARLQARGAFAGRTGRESYRVACGDDVNPAYAAEAGRLVVEIKVAPSRPMAFLTIRLVQLGDKSRVLELA